MCLSNLRSHSCLASRFEEAKRSGFQIPSPTVWNLDSWRRPLWAGHFGNSGSKRNRTWNKIEGSISLLSLLGLMAALTLALGTVQLLWRWRHLMQEQLRLDHCVAQTAADLKNRLTQLKAANLRIHALRAALLAAQAQPETIPPLRLALGLQVALQDEALTAWKVKQVFWLLPTSCKGRNDSHTPLPSLNFIRPPADGIGPQALTGFDRLSALFRIEAWHLPRKAVAFVHHSIQPSKTGTWTASWRARPILN